MFRTDAALLDAGAGIFASVPCLECSVAGLQRCQLNMFASSKGIVMDGRDIGTTVFPNAEIKLFVNAPAETRAERRYKELTEKGVETTYDEVLQNIKQRDFIDETRAESPLCRASDAIDVDNSGLSIEEQDRLLDKIVAEKLKTLSL